MNVNKIKRRLEEIGADMDEVISHPLNVFDESFREIRKIVKILSTDEDFVKLDKLGVLSDETDTSAEEYKPFNAMLQSLRKEQECNPIMIIDEIYSRLYGLILALEEYKKYTK